MLYQGQCSLYLLVIVLVFATASAARFKKDPYRFKNMYYRKAAADKQQYMINNILEAHATDPNAIQKAMSLEKFLFEMPDPSVNGGYRQMLRDQRKQGEVMDVEMKKTRDKLREKALHKIYDKGGNIQDDEGKLLKQVLECRGGGAQPKLAKDPETYESGNLVL